MNKKYHIGFKGTTNQGYDYEIINILKGFDRVEIMFLDNKNTKIVKKSQIILNNFTNPYHKTLFKTGYMGEGKYVSKINNIETLEYSVWHSLIRRCYSEDHKNKFENYNNFIVCKEWHNFQIFSDWANKQVGFKKGNHLDKDIMNYIYENKVYIYSPETCFFVPQELNKLLAKIGEPRGISKHYNKFVVYSNDDCSHRKYLGSFYNIEDAIECYFIHKENMIKLQANKFKNEIDIRLYNILINFKIKRNLKKE